MRILLADINHEVLEHTLADAGHECTPAWDWPVDQILQRLPEFEGLVIRSRFRLTKEILAASGSLRCIGRVGAGMENIDLNAASAKGISVVCAPEGNRDAVAEHAIGMLLMLFNNLKKADTEVRRGIWLRAENRGREIAGKTVGIIGYGQMGSALALRLSGFGCRILAHDKYRRDFGNDHVSESSLEQIQREADIISLHLPLTDETRHYVDAHFLYACNKPVYLINTARGQCVDTSALVTALESGRVAGACLDVLEYESVTFEKLDMSHLPAPFKYLLEAENVILSPHIAGWTHESNYKMSRIVAEKMIAALAKNQAYK